MDSKEVGKTGEDFAVSYLKKKGYKILERNYIPQIISGPQIGEIDIVAEKKGVLVFVEIKTSLRDGFVEPEERINIAKQKRLIRSAEAYFLEKGLSPNQQWQIDVIALIIDQIKGKIKIRHFKNAICQK